MEQATDREAAEFYQLTGAIRAQCNSLKKSVLTPEEKKERESILAEFDNTIQAQVFSTTDHLSSYQLKGWRELIDGGDDGRDATDPAQSAD